MNNVYHLRDLILGLAVITPLACQSPPATRDTDNTHAEQTTTRVESAEEPGQEVATAAESSDEQSEQRQQNEQGDMERSPPKVDAPAEPPAPEPSPQVTAATRTAERLVRISHDKGARIAAWMGRGEEGAVEHMIAFSPVGPPVKGQEEQGGRCISPKQVYAIQKHSYEQQYEAWKAYKAQYRDKKTPKPPGMWTVAKPEKPTRKIKTCPASLVTRIGTPSRCGTSGGAVWYLAAQVDDGGAMACCYAEPPRRYPRPCGRLYLVEDHATRAQLRETRAWMGEEVALLDGVSTELAERAARAWLEDALEEHASIAAFSRATLELMALGAPADLLAEYQRASLDEIRHARACFALVAALSGQDISAGKIDVEGPRDDLDAIVADVFWGGCVGESVAALCAQRALRHCSWEPARAALEQISEDEARHAALAWSTLSFLGEIAPERVRRLLESVEPVTHARGVASAVKPDASWNALGRLTRAQEDRAEVDAWGHLISPMIDRLLRA